MPDAPLFTVGHSNHPWETFAGLLTPHRIDLLVDVRSVPRSRFCPWANREALAAHLAGIGIDYTHEAAAFGARRTDPAVLGAEGRVDFERVRATPAFADGMRRLLAALAAGRRPVLLCAEADPLDCHRFIMLAPALKAAGIAPTHLLRDGTALTNADLEARLLGRYRRTLEGGGLFGPATDAERLAEAYRLANRAIGYTAPPR